jgi:hypothetical protein
LRGQLVDRLVFLERSDLLVLRSNQHPQWNPNDFSLPGQGSLKRTLPLPPGCVLPISQAKSSIWPDQAQGRRGHLAGRFLFGFNPAQ